MISDRDQRRELNKRIAESIQETKGLQAAKKKIEERITEKKEFLDVAKKKEAEVKSRIGKKNLEAILLVEKVFRKHSIEKPYYHGGKYNGKAMNAFMTNSHKIMDEISEVLLGIPEENRCNNSEVAAVTSKFKDVLQIFDTIFSMTRIPSGFFGEQEKLQLQGIVTAGMKLWRELELSMEAPKPHAVEDHLCDQLIMFHGIGDLTEDFVEQAHQDGIREDRRTRTMKDRSAVASIHCKWEHKRKLPAVIMRSEEVTARSVRVRRSSDINGVSTTVPISRFKEQEKVLRSEDKKNIRAVALQNVTATEGPFFLTGRQRNITDAQARMVQFTVLINKGVRIFLAKRRLRKLRQPISIMNKTVRVLLAKIKRNRIQQVSWHE